MENPQQQRLRLNTQEPERSRTSSASDFSAVYRNDALANRLNKLERAFKYSIEEQRFRNLVNPSLSKTREYHRWGRYREAYSGELVKELIDRSNINRDRHFVFDPMCGSGSTLVAAAQEGFDSVGSDVNPYAIDLAKAKIHPYSNRDLEQVKAFIAKTKPSPGERTYPSRDGHEYFRESNYQQLQSIRDCIREVKNESARNLLFVAWLTILEDCSERRKEGNGLATRPSSIHDVWSRFIGQVKMFLVDLQNHPLPSSSAAAVELISATEARGVINRYAKRTNKELGVVVFSPPYANSFDYFESYKIELLLGEYVDKESLGQAREDAIRNYRKGYGYQLTTDNQLVHWLAEEVRARIPEKEARTGRTDGRSRLVPNLLIGYFEDMEEVLSSISASMPSGSKCYIVVDQSSYLGVIIPTDLVLAESALRHDLRVTQLIRCRKAVTSSQQLKRYPYLKNMLRESIVSLEKV